MAHLKGNLSPMYKNEPVINHLLYADDLLVFAKATIGNDKTIKNVIQNLENRASLVMNEQKSKLFFSKGAQPKSRITDILIVEIKSLPIIYLGIPLSCNSLRRADFNRLIDKVKRK